MASQKIRSERVVLPEEVEPVHYSLTITPNLSGDFVFPGHVDIDLNLKSSSIAKITLHSKELTLSKASFKGAKGSKAVEAKEISYDEKATTVSLDFGSNLPEGRGVLSIDYTGLHNNQMAGFYRSGYTDKEGNKKTMVSTQFEPLDARRCFPCVDEPARKAEFTCTLVVDEGLTALSNMPIEKTTKTGDKKVSIKFEKTPKMSTYLLAFCLGEFDYVETKTKNGVLLRVYTPPGKQALGEFALDAGAKSLDIYDDMFGVPFPLPKMDMIGIPEFAMGAMENWGLVTYREVDILIDAKRASSQQKQRVCTVVAHELAHQWFGNLVTMAWWDDLWLNEGFASWMQNYASDLIYPEWSLWEQFIIDQQSLALSLDSMTSSHPIQVPIKHAEEVEEVFDIISYRKGASIVRLIHAYLGQENFVKGLQLYMDRHKYGNTETFNLWNAWEEVSKQPISKVMASWTEQMGYPLITVVGIKELEGGKCELDLQQKWYLADGSTPPESETKLWSVPLFAVTEAGEQRLPLMTERSMKVKVNMKKGGWLKLNANQYIPIRVNYPDDLWEKLQAAVSSKKLSTNDRSGLIIDAFALAKSGDLDPAMLLKLLSAYQGEEELPVWDALAGVLHGLDKVLLEDEELLSNFQKLAKTLILPLQHKIGWDSKASDGHLGKMLRAKMVGLVAKFCADDGAVQKEARERYDAYVKDPSNEKMAEILPSEYRTDVLRIVLKNSKGREEFDTLMKLQEELETTVEKKDVYLALGFVPDVALKKEVLDWCTSGDIKLQDFFYPIFSVSGSGAEGLNLAWEYYKDNFNKYDEMLKTASASLMGAVITYSASGFTTEEKASEIEHFFVEHKTRVERKVAQLVEGTRTTAKFREMLEKSAEFKAFLASI